MISNGSLLTDEKVNLILDAGIDELGISLEAANREKYESIRVGAKFDRLLENLNRLNELRMKRQTDRLALSFNTVLMKRTLSELVPLIDLAKKAGVATFCMTHLTPFAGLDNEQESLYYHQKLANEKIKEAREYAESSGIRVFCPPLFGTKEQDDPRPSEKGAQGLACLHPWTFMVINCEGDVVPCGWLYGEDRVGSFKKHSFRQVWFGDGYTRLRWEIRTRNLRPRCAACAAAGLGDPNRKESFELVYL